jgi:hypothetical protein
MANPLPNESEIYEKIKNGEFYIHPEVIELIRHHIGNDLQVIYLGTQMLLDTPIWIVKTTCFINKVLMTIHFRGYAGSPDAKHVYQETITRIKNIEGVLSKVKRVSRINEQSSNDQEAG